MTFTPPLTHTHSPSLVWLKKSAHLENALALVILSLFAIRQTGTPEKVGQGLGTFTPLVREELGVPHPQAGGPTKLNPHPAFLRTLSGPTEDQKRTGPAVCDLRGARKDWTCSLLCPGQISPCGYREPTSCKRPFPGSTQLTSGNWTWTELRCWPLPDIL